MIKLDVHEFDERDLLGRVMRNMHGTSRHGDPRWVVVKNTFGVGSTVAHALCATFNLNPDDDLRGPGRVMDAPYYLIYLACAGYFVYRMLT